MKLHPKTAGEMTPLPSGEVSPKPDTPVSPNGDAADAGASSKKYSAKRLAGLKKGGKKGAKHKATKLREAFEAQVTKVAEGKAVTPLAAMLMILSDALGEYEEAKAHVEVERKLPAPQADDEAAKQARRDVFNRAKAAANKVVDVASQAAPYCHAKLASVENKGKLGVKVSVRGFGAPPEKAGE